jgi:hypothetical protein
VALLNYTTKISVAKTAAEIQAKLGAAGADAIMLQYEGGTPTALRFRINTSFGPQAYSLPVSPDPVYKVLLCQSSYGARDKIPRSFATMDQAARVAWRITKDWVEAQMAIIETEMVSLEQVMLPYMETAEGETFFEMVKNQQLALPRGSDTELN